MPKLNGFLAFEGKINGTLTDNSPTPSVGKQERVGYTTHAQHAVHTTAMQRVAELDERDMSPSERVPEVGLHHEHPTSATEDTELSEGDPPSEQQGNVLGTDGYSRASADHISEFLDRHYSRLRTERQLGGPPASPRTGPEPYSAEWVRAMRSRYGDAAE